MLSVNIFQQLSNAVAMCKKDHAYILWGINDETHEIVGTKFDFKINVKKELLEHYLARQIIPDIAFSFHEVIINEKRIIILDIPSATNISTSFNGKRYMRIGSSKVNLAK